MSKLSKNLILEGIFSVETPDTAGEVLDVAGADISELQTGKASLNTEHINPEDADKEEMHKDEEDFKGFNSIVGRVINAKKIMSQEDCQSDKEIRAWNEFQRPMIYGAVEIWDGPEAHDNARAAATVARMFNKNQEGPQLGLSVEGATLKREGNILRRTVIRKMALTMKPANRAATIDIVKDSAAPSVSKSMSAKAEMGASEPLRKSVAMQYVHMEMPEVINDFGLSGALAMLRKALEAGSTNAAPGALTGGAALQKESQLAKLVKLCGNKSPSRALIKTVLKGISDHDAAKIEDYFNRRNLNKNIKLAESAFEELFGKKK